MREYEVKIGGIPHTMQLNELDAKRFGAAERARLDEKIAPVRRKRAKPDADND